VKSQGDNKHPRSRQSTTGRKNFEPENGGRQKETYRKRSYKGIWGLKRLYKREKKKVRILDFKIIQEL